MKDVSVKIAELKDKIECLENTLLVLEEELFFYSRLNEKSMEDSDYE